MNSSFRRINKLVVHIEQCETHIFYDDRSKRKIYNNASGLAFNFLQRPYTEKTRALIGCQNQAAAFLEHHFGINSGINMANYAKIYGTHAIPIQFERANEYDNNIDETRRSIFDDSSESTSSLIDLPIEDSSSSFENFMALYCKNETEPTCIAKEQMTWTVEPIIQPEPQMAKIVELEREQMEVYNRAWHLQNCVWRKLRERGEQVKCRCLKIKETMDFVNALVTSKLSQTDIKMKDKNRETRDATKFEDLNATVHDVNLHLKHLNDLLAQQTQINEWKRRKLRHEQLSV